MLVPLVDILNHASEDPNVSWRWHVAPPSEDGKEIKGSSSSVNGTIVVETLRDVSPGEELLKCYGWRPAWDVMSSYGFVPALVKERWECAAVSLFLSVLRFDDDGETVDLLAK